MREDLDKTLRGSNNIWDQIEEYFLGAVRLRFMAFKIDSEEVDVLFEFRT